MLAQVALSSEVQVAFADEQGWTLVSGKAQSVDSDERPAPIRERLDELTGSWTAVRVSVLSARHWPRGQGWDPDVVLTSADVVGD